MPLLGRPICRLHSQSQGEACFFFVQTREPRKLRLGERYFRNAVFDLVEVERMERAVLSLVRSDPLGTAAACGSALSRS